MDNNLYRWETLTEKNFPQKSGEYFGLLNEVEKCIIFIQGGKVVKVKFSNNAEFSDSFRDMTKLNLSIPVKVEADQQELWRAADDLLFTSLEISASHSEHIIELLKSKYLLTPKASKQTP